MAVVFSLVIAYLLLSKPKKHSKHNPPHAAKTPPPEPPVDKS